MIIIKFGGSIITNKSKKGVYNSKVTSQLLDELRQFYEDKSVNKKGKKKKSEPKINYDLILVHGAGSFGHISAKKYQLDEGFQDREQLIGLSEVHHDVRDLNLRFMHDLLLNGFPGISIPPMIILRNRAKMISYMDSEMFGKVIDMQCIPVTFGDVVPDDSLGFSICSGDSIIQKLSLMFKPERVIFITDVDGLFTSNPVLDKNAKLITNLTSKSFSTACMNENINLDVTGGIHLKAKIALSLGNSGIQTYLINGNETGRLSSALLGESVVGTIAKR
jgi:isopentenyl phosphate kinase